MEKEQQIPLPEAYLEKMKRLLGEEYQAFIESYEKERVSGLRLNPLKWEAEGEKGKEGQNSSGSEISGPGIEERFGLEKIPWAREGYYYKEDKRPGMHPLHEAGAYYIQEPSAMAAAELLDPKPGEIILDLCGAPGGKTTQIAGRMNQAGLLVSNEIRPARAKILSQNVERMGIGNAVVTNEDSRTLLNHFPEFFDKILVDAPCSGEGMFRKDQQARREWSPDNVELCARRQAEILNHAAGMLKSGGRLVYSTCTFSPEENEGSIQAFLKQHHEFELEEEVLEGFSFFSHGRPEWVEGGMQELSKTFRIWPHQTRGEGHFLAVLRKRNVGKKYKTLDFHGVQHLKKTRGTEEKEGKKDKRTTEVWEKWRQFAETELFISSADRSKEAVKAKRSVWETGRPLMFGDQLYVIPGEMADIKGLKVLRPGLHLGEYKKNRFEPSHSLALYLKKEQARQWASLKGDGSLIRKYLSGEAIDPGCLEGAHTSLSEKGWVLMLVDSCSIGWAKLAGNMLKNHYPKGLRR